MRSNEHISTFLVILLSLKDWNVLQEMGGLEWVVLRGPTEMGLEKELDNDCRARH